MTTLMYLVAGVIMVADMSFYDSYELMIEHGCSKIWDPDRMVVREVWKGVIDEKIWHLKTCTRVASKVLEKLNKKH
jgi:hypothetical protein